MKKYINFVFYFLLILAFALSPTYIGDSARAEVVSSTVGAVEALDGSPAWIYIPSINLFSYVEGVGIDEKGRMDVPSGKTNNVGWYKYGKLPGDAGTAVFDAHNTAAFKNLYMVAPGEDIYVLTTSGRMLRFTISRAETYSMAVLSPNTLFEETNSRQINLITCAGTLLGGGEATHRLIVSAELADPFGPLQTVVSSTPSA